MGQDRSVEQALVRAAWQADRPGLESMSLTRDPVPQPLDTTAPRLDETQSMVDDEDDAEALAVARPLHP